MELPAINESNAKAIALLTTYSEERIDPMPFFNKFAAPFGGIVTDDPRYSKPLYPDFENYDYLHDTSKLRPIYLNDLDLKLEEHRETLGRLTRMEFSGNSFETIAKCSCGHLRGNFRLREDRPQICERCGDPPEKFLNKGDKTKLWLKAPEGVDRFVNLGFLTTFFSNIAVGSPKVCVPWYFLDKDYRREVDKNRNTTGIVLRNMFETLGISEFNINTFYRNADALMEYILIGPGRKYFKDTKEGPAYMEVWERNKDIAFPYYMKVPNRYSTILEKSGKDTFSYSYQPITAALYVTLVDSLKSNICHQLTPAELQKNAETVGKTLVTLSEQYRSTNNPKGLFEKHGLNRKHCASGSVPFTGRSIITSQTGVIDPDLLIVPWKMAISMLEIHIKNYLYRRGHTPYKALARIKQAAYHIDPLIDEFFRDMEENNKCLIQAGRNPSIEYLSCRTFKFGVNRDLEDESFKLPILGVKIQNADFDGDQIYAVVLVDNESKAKAYGGWGHHQTLDRNNPFRVGDYASQTATNLMNLNTLMHTHAIID